MAKMNGQPMYWAAFNNILRLFKSNEKLFLQQCSALYLTELAVNI